MDCFSCSKASQCGSLSQEKSTTACTEKGIPSFAPLAKGSRIFFVLAVGSGKGGVGKSTVTALLATMLNRRGYKVGILDADLTGPTMAQAFGVYDAIYGNEEGLFLPARTLTNMDLMSLNLLLPSADDPVVWRGPILSQVITQFWSEVQWGQLDILLIDMPPGTSDVALTIFQSLPIDRFLLVSTPQDLVSLIVQKSCKMAKNMKVQILGLIENFASFHDKLSGQIFYPFGKGRGEEVAKALGVPYLQGLPIQEKITKAMDLGHIETLQGDFLTETVESIAQLIDRKKSFFERYMKR